MKASILCMTIIFLLLTFAPLQTIAVTGPDKPLTSSPKPLEGTAPNAMTLRLNEINAMDMTNMSRHEKHQLRKEIRTIKRQATRSNGGIYISSVALLILIIVLLILLL